MMMIRLVPYVYMGRRAQRVIVGARIRIRSTETSPAGPAQWAGLMWREGDQGPPLRTYVPIPMCYSIRTNNFTFTFTVGETTRFPFPVLVCVAASSRIVSAWFE